MERLGLKQANMDNLTAKRGVKGVLRRSRYSVPPLLGICQVQHGVHCRRPKTWRRDDRGGMP